jgi:ABC-type glycerol-3-phosphate transport system permease component
MFAMTFIQKQSLWLSTVGLSINMSRVGMDWSTLLPQTVITCLIPVIFYFIFQRYIVKGLSAGAVKL